MKKLKKILLKTILYTTCWRNVDKLYNLWSYDSNNVKLKKGGRRKMFKKLELIIKNNNLKRELEEIKTENESNRNETENTNLKIYHAKILAEKTIDALENLQEIDRKGIEEKEKIKLRNTIINNLRIKNIDIIKELDNASGKCI